MVASPPTGALLGRTILAGIADAALGRSLAAAVAGAGGQMALACPDRATVRAVNEADRPGVVGFAIPLDDAGAWERLLAHAEQRLGPIDAMVVAGGVPPTVVSAVAADMAARGAGSLVTVGDPTPAVAAADGVRRVSLSPCGEAARDAAAIVDAVTGW